MLSDKLKDDGLLKHSIAIAPNFRFSPKEFYDRVENEIHAKKLPGLSISRVGHSEGGLLSDKRIYLRILRERFVFDTCAAPFGTEFFFSYRSVYSPAVLKVTHVLAVMAFLGLLYLPLIWYLGLLSGSIAAICVVLAIAMVFKNAAVSETPNVDGFLLKIPGIGPIYEVFFRKDTYYRQDTRLLYLEIIPRIVQEIIDDVTAQNGIKLNQFDRAPILGELYRPKK